VLLNNDGKTLLNKPTDYQNGHDPKVYQAFLECGLEAFKQLQKDGSGERLGIK
jgi:hypothetical protein